MKLNERQTAFLRVLANVSGGERGGMGAARIFVVAFPDEPYRGRRDAGATRTLDSMETLGLVRGDYRGYHPTGRDWRITNEGLALARELGLVGEQKRVGLAQHMNGVPDCPGYIYGLAKRSGTDVAVDVTTPDGETLHVKGIGWAGHDGIHAVAKRMIEERERRV